MPGENRDGLEAIKSAGRAAENAGIGPRGGDVLAARRILAAERQASALERIAEALEDLDLHPSTKKPLREYGAPMEPPF